MGYLVKEIFYTLQGEGAQAGRPAREERGELWLTGRPRYDEDEEEARTLVESCDGLAVDGLDRRQGGKAL